MFISCTRDCVCTVHVSVLRIWFFVLFISVAHLILSTEHKTGSPRYNYGIERRKKPKHVDWSPNISNRHGVATAITAAFIDLFHCQTLLASSSHCVLFLYHFCFQSPRFLVVSSCMFINATLFLFFFFSLLFID